MNYPETLEYLYAQLPMFHRVGAQAYKADLVNTVELLNSLNNPHKHFKSIHVAGTNGKGSSSHMLASIMQASGLKTGLYTSPHLLDFRERIKINGEMISEQKVVDFIERTKNTIEIINPSFFELCVAMAFEHFANEKVDIAIIEVGMGGRLDSTNVIQAECSLITNISFDHMQFLGDTLEKIATEKAGIIKSNCPVVISETQNACKNVFLNKAEEKNTEIYFADNTYEILKKENDNYDLAKFEVKGSHLGINEIECSLTGSYQEKNIAGVLKCIDILIDRKFPIKKNDIITGLRNVKSSTGLRGRWDCIGKEPLIIADTGHNEDGIKEVLNQIKKIKFNKLHWVWGMVNDKDPQKIFKLLPTNASYYYCKPNIPRGLDAEQCMKMAAEFGLKGKAYNSVKEALENAKYNAKTDDLILIAGSTFIVAEVL